MSNTVADCCAHSDDEHSGCEAVDLPALPTFQSYQELLDYYHKFLKREVESPHDVLEEESNVIVPQLLAINRGGVLSFSSQPGSVVVDDQGKLVARQRAYLSCYMRSGLAERLEALVTDESELVIFVEQFSKLQDEPITTITVTQDSVDNELIPVTGVPLLWNFGDLDIMLSDTPEELHSEVTDELVQVHFVDLKWGRETYLFDTLAKWLA